MLTLPITENWDIISDNVALTRGDIRGLYNPILEAEYGTPNYEGLDYWFYGSHLVKIVHLL